MTRLTHMGPLVWTQPAPGSPEAFREDEFVSLWSEMYVLLLKLNFWRREDVVFPPENTGRHTNLDRHHLRVELGMSPEAVSLIERLPYPRIAPYKRMRIFPEADAMNYLEWDDLKDCRDPQDMAHYSTRASNMSDSSYLLPQDVALARPDESDGLACILDIDYNAFRFIHGVLETPARGCDDLPQNYPIERPEDPDHYRNWPTYHAPTVLRRWIQDLLDLEVVPASIQGEYWNFPSDVQGQVIIKALRRYGWPASFREQDWARDSKEIFRAASDVTERYEKSFDPHKFGRDRDELLSQWREDADLIPYVGLDLSE
ncbi:hypothetical protein EsH8_V_001168 [Colletotrichum jinshuiense]